MFNIKPLMDRVSGKNNYVPLDVVQLSKDSGIDISYHNMDGDITGVLNSNKPNHYSIMVNTSSSLHSQRMAISVLLSHALIDVASQVKNITIDSNYQIIQESTDDYSKGASMIHHNIMMMARELLFPYKIIKTFANYGLSLEEISDEVGTDGETILTILKDDYKLSPNGLEKVK